MSRAKRWALAACAVLALVPAVLWGVSVEPVPGLRPPEPPAHARRNLSTAAELATDLAEVVEYLEAGQAYYRAFQKGTHTAEENNAFLKFLETYEKEHKTAKQEVEALRNWVLLKGSLDEAGK